MATIEVQPIVLKDVMLLIPTDDYRKHCSRVELTPSTQTATWYGLGNNSFTGVSASTWVAALEYAQDWATEGSLSRYLFEHEGEKVTITFAPEDGGTAFEVEVFVVPGAIGGAVNGVGTASVTLPCTGRPEIVTDTPNPSTTATAGTPGTFDNDVPEDITELQSLGALGNSTAWGTGEYVILGDASHAYWDGSAWQVGEAP